MFSQIYAEKFVPFASRRVGRPTSARVRSECLTIARMIAQGESERSIRRTLRLSRKTYRQRLAVLDRAGVNVGWLWTRFLAGQQALLRELAALVDQTQGGDVARFRSAIDAIMASARVSSSIVEMAVLLRICDPGLHG